MFRAWFLRRESVCLLALLVGCSDGQLENSAAGVATASEASLRCQPLGDAEELVGVSPEGEAWLSTDTGVRVITPEGAATDVDARFTQADQFVAWDASSAFVVGDNTLWNTTVAGSETVAIPPELGKPKSVCGDPRNDGGAFVITTRGLFERRAATWQRWDLPLELLESLELRSLQGACSGQQPLLHMIAGQSLWEIHHGENAFFREVADLSDASDSAADIRIGFVALKSGALTRLDEGKWVNIPFDEGLVEQMSMSDGVLWATVGTEMYRRDRFDRWERLEFAIGLGSVSQLEGYAAGGAWAVSDRVLCHVGHRETLRVAGIRPYGTLAPGAMPASLMVTADPAMGSSLRAAVDGNALQVTGDAGAWTVTSGAFDAGWHTLSLDLSSPSGTIRRSVPFLIEGDAVEPTPTPEPTVFWEADILPIYEAACAMCHGADGNQTFLGNYEAFSALGARAADLVARGNMPPLPATPLGATDVGLLQTWVEEGMAR